MTTPVNRFLEPTGTKAYTNQRETLSGSVKLAHNNELRLFSEHGKHKGTFSFTRTLGHKRGKTHENILLRAKGSHPDMVMKDVLRQLRKTCERTC